METSTLLSAQEWAEQTFGEVQLGHRRRRERAVKMAAAIAADPAGSLPKQMGNEAALHAAYRFLQTPQVSYEQLMRPHQEQTRAAMRKPERVLLIQDTTEVDYQQHPTTTELGPIGNGTHHGFAARKRCWRSCQRAERCSALPTRSPSCVNQPPRKKPSESDWGVRGNRRSGNAVCKCWERLHLVSSGST